MNPTLLLTALAPLVWGSTYLLTTSYLSNLSPMLLATLRVLPAGLLLMLLVRTWPPREWWLKIGVLALLKQSLFFALLYASALRLPGGVAATIGASTPAIVMLLALPLLGQKPTARGLALAAVSLVGVGLISLNGGARLDGLGLLAALGFAFVNALGSVLLKRWGWPQGATPLHQTAWELTLAGLFLLPFSLGGMEALGQVSALGWAALAFLTVVSTALAALVWQRGLNLLPVQQVSLLSPLSPLTAVILDLVVLHRALTPSQLLGAALVIGSVVVNALPDKATPPTAAQAS